MPFTSATFLFVFLPLTIILYYVFNFIGKIKLNNLLLILFSLVFYAVSGLRTLAYLLVFIFIMYLSGKILSTFRDDKTKKGILIIFLTFITLVLCYYKYITFILELFSKDIKEFSIVIPLGLSFIMFEGISYLVDSYKNGVKSGSLVDVMLFFTFFPKIASGPIVLWRDFYPQIYKRKVSVDLFFSGMNRIMIGLAKKSIIADSLGVVVQNINENVTLGIDSPTAFFGALCYFLQIYYDFSGYSDIAIGVSRIFGFEFKENFNSPYTSTSIGEFWRRWHISLGTWFREYIYIPLGGNRKHVYLNLFIVFLITGIWHGSTFNFVIWGISHGILIMLERASRNNKWYKKIPSGIKWIFTMVFVYLTWIIFMLPSLKQAIIYYKSMFGVYVGDIYFTFEYFVDEKVLIIVCAALVGAFVGKWKIVEIIRQWTQNTKWGLIFSQIIYIGLFILAVWFMMNSSYSPFLYFQF
ncbi:MBOAT family O-acyltransferase [uncultured Gemella sp.]|uniref:MBOAT family O-acyltransferase n=1 Tax=uncultured Gemella sp. TaxID=254352 RepID=UPI0028D8B86B|nr:MBOAT family O-acyltransferase [uncultured Gemella sp.]